MLEAHVPSYLPRLPFETRLTVLRYALPCVCDIRKENDFRLLLHINSEIRRDIFRCIMLHKTLRVDLSNKEGQEALQPTSFARQIDFLGSINEKDKGYCGEIQVTLPGSLLEALVSACQQSASGVPYCSIHTAWNYLLSLLPPTDKLSIEVLRDAERWCKDSTVCPTDLNFRQSFFDDTVAHSKVDKEFHVRCEQGDMPWTMRELNRLLEYKRPGHPFSHIFKSSSPGQYTFS